MNNKNHFPLRINIWLPCTIFLFITFIIWWTPSLFVKDTYLNTGDILFPLIPEKELGSRYYMWNPNANDALGGAEWFHNTIVYYLFPYFLGTFGIPLWIINRLWLMFPTLLLCLTTYYMMRSFINERYSAFSSVIGVLIVVFQPFQFVAPVMYISFAMIPLILASLIKGLKSDSNYLYHSFLIAIGVLFIMGSPRYLYITTMIVIFSIVVNFILKGKGSLNSKIKFIGITIAITILLNFFWIFPLSNFFANYSSSSQSLMPQEQALTARFELVHAYRNWCNPIWTLRLITKNSEAVFYKYFSNPFCSTFLFITTLYAYTCLLTSKKKYIAIISVPAILFLFFASAIREIPDGPIAWTYQLYKFLMVNVPGFWIINNPMWWLAIVAFIYALFVAETTEFILEKIDKTKKYGIVFKKVIKTSFFLLLFSTLVIVYGGHLTFDYIFVKSVWGHVANGNHLPYAKIPSEYYDLRNYLAKNAKPVDKLLILPWTRGGYPRFTWWRYMNMPDIVSFVSPVSTAGYSEYPFGIFKSLDDILKKNKYDSAIAIIKLFGFKYIVVHKDHLYVPGVYDPKLLMEDYLTKFLNDKDFKVIINNDYFTLFGID